MFKNTTIIIKSNNKYCMHFSYNNYTVTTPYYSFYIFNEKSRIHIYSKSYMNFVAKHYFHTDSELLKKYIESSLDKQLGLINPILTNVKSDIISNSEPNSEPNSESNFESSFESKKLSLDCIDGLINFNYLNDFDCLNNFNDFNTLTWTDIPDYSTNNQTNNQINKLVNNIETNAKDQIIFLDTFDNYF